MLTNFKNSQSGTYTDIDTTQVNTLVSAPNMGRVRKATYISQPAGLAADPASDFWIQMEFAFDASKSEVVVTRWWITDVNGTTVNLSKLKYNHIQFLAQAMLEEHEFQIKYYYDELESNYYSK